MKSNIRQFLKKENKNKLNREQKNKERKESKLNNK